MHSNSLAAFYKYGLPYFKADMKVLEVGPDPHWSCKQFVEQAGCRYQYSPGWPPSAPRSGGAVRSQAEPGNEGALADPGRVSMRNEYAFDSPEGAFDIVFSANVIEHVRKPWQWLPELARITRAGGLLICVNPVSWPYHEAPVDCWRLFPEAYRALFEEAGLEHVFSWHGNLVPIDRHWLADHGPHVVTDTIAIGRKA